MERDFLVVLITQNRKAASKHLEEKKILLLLPRFKREVVKFNEKLLKREIIRAQELFQKTIFCSLDVNFQYVYPGVTTTANCFLYMMGTRSSFVSTTTSIECIS